MEKKHLLKLTGYSLVAILILNMILFALRIISGLVFWIIIVVGAVIAYWVLPRLKNQSH